MTERDKALVKKPGSLAPLMMLAGLLRLNSLNAPLGAGKMPKGGKYRKGAPQTRNGKHGCFGKPKWMREQVE